MDFPLDHFDRYSPPDFYAKASVHSYVENAIRTWFNSPMKKLINPN